MRIIGIELFEKLVIEQVELAKYTNLGIGGPARYFAEAPNPESVIAGIRWAESGNLPVFILGGGSNIVVADSGFPGLVLRPRILGIETIQTSDTVTVTVGAGEDWDTLVSTCVANSWAGVECLSGIPGSVGATPIQNVGAYGQEISETMASLTAIDKKTLELVTITREECEFGYRTSRFKTKDRDRFIITTVSYRLRPDGAPSIRYPELQRYLANHYDGPPSLSNVREAVIAIRKKKAMVIDPADTDSRSVGSFFVNPVVTSSEFERIKQRAQRHAITGADIVSFPVADGKTKLSAAWLIEHSGFPRGFEFGNVGTSTKHSLAIINRGEGTAAEVKELAEKIISEVNHRFGVGLVPEPVFVGFES